jgi:Domain of unknown function (DUF4190)
MKRCPNCGRTYEEEWLSFCTQDGTALIDTAGLRPKPPPTVTPPPPRETNRIGQPTMNMPASYIPPAPLSPAWQVPLPPPIVSAPQQTSAIVSMCLGIFSLTIGWCCYLGVLTAPIAVALGGYQLSQIKKDETKFGGKGFAIAGVVTGIAYFVFLAFFVLIYGMSFLMNLNK